MLHPIEIQLEPKIKINKSTAVVGFNGVFVTL